MKPFSSYETIEGVQSAFYECAIPDPVDKKADWGLGYVITRSQRVHVMTKADHIDYTTIFNDNTVEESNGELEQSIICRNAYDGYQEADQAAAILKKIQYFDQKVAYLANNIVLRIPSQRRVTSMSTLRCIINMHHENTIVTGRRRHHVALKRRMISSQTKAGIIPIDEIDHLAESHWSTSVNMEVVDRLLRKFVDIIIFLENETMQYIPPSALLDQCTAERHRLEEEYETYVASFIT